MMQPSPIELPSDWTSATLLGRAWIPGGARSVADHRPPRRRGHRSLRHRADDQRVARAHGHGRLRCGPRRSRVGTIDALFDNSTADFDPAQPRLLAPCDLQAIKAAGVTFVASMLERVIEEQARGDASRAEGDPRRACTAIIGDDLASCAPGSAEAARIKQVLIEQGAWSQYLEVGIGPDAEIFTKSQPMSAVGYGALIGVHPKSTWNNPEPEVVLAVDSRGRDRRRDARQRRQPARLRGPQRAAARQGQGQQRVVRDRPVHPPVRRPASRSTTCAARRSRSTSHGDDGFHARRRELDELDQPRSRGPRRADDRRATISIPTASCCSSARCSRRSRTAARRAWASRTSPATSCVIAARTSGRAREPRRPPATARRRGPSASAS